MTTEWERPGDRVQSGVAPTAASDLRNASSASNVLSLPVYPWLLARRFLPVAGLAIVVVLLAALWMLTATAVEISLDGASRVVWTHRPDVASLLLDLGIDVDKADLVSPGGQSRIRDAAGTAALSVQRAPRFRIRSDGRLTTVTSWGATVGDILRDAELMADSYDQVVVNGVRLNLEDPLPAPRTQRVRSTYWQSHTWSAWRAEPYDIRIVRAVPIEIDDGTLPFTVRTTAQTVGEALREAEITIFLGDIVQPGLGTEVVTGLRVRVQRSRPVAIRADGRILKTRTRGETVSDALAEMKVGISGKDIVVPGLESELYDGIEIGITRVREDIEVEEEIAPFETVFVPDVNLAMDTQQLVEAGAEGITRSRFRVRYEDEQETARELEDTWVAQEPAERVIAYGQRIDPHTFTAANGQQYTYWRKIRMYASSYSAGTAGVSPDKAYYGKTYTGDVMRKGIVAVDPAIIPLRSQVYVEDYGIGDALDMGSAIRARRIDLGFDDSNLQMWNKWVDVYLLWPPPPAHEITWVLPNWPRPPQ